MTDPDGSRVMRGTLPFTLDVAYELVVPSSPPPSAGHPVVLVLHGFGEDGRRMRERFTPLVDSGMAVLAPDGPYPVEMRPKTTDESARIGRAWYQFTGDQEAFIAACATSAAHLARVLDAAAAAKRLDRDNVVLVGYSQGGYLAGVWALSEPSRFRALVAIACRIKTEVFPPEALAAAKHLAVLAIHGTADVQVRVEPQRAAIEALRARGFAAELELHDGGHGLRREVVAAVYDFVVQLPRFLA